MGKALLTGLISSKFANPADCVVVEKREGERQALAAEFPGVNISASLVPLLLSMEVVPNLDILSPLSELLEASYVGIDHITTPFLRRRVYIHLR